MARKKKQSRKYIPMNEFRYPLMDTYREHPQYVFGKTRSGKYKSLGLTHTPDGKHSVIPLSENPNPRDKRKAYIGTNPHTLAEKDYDPKPKKNWKFAKKDKPIVRHIIKQYKKRTNRKPKNWYVNKKKKKQTSS